MVPDASPFWIARGTTILDDRRPRVMGIVNVTPDSFSDGSRTSDPRTAVARARAMVQDGVDLLDVGGESSRPGAEPIAEQEELRRVLPVIEAIVGAFPQLPISVDTTKTEVARRAMDAGAKIINDITGLGDPEMLRFVAGSDAGIVLMHMAGTPKTMQANPSYRDVVEDVYDFLARRVETAEAMGIERSRIAIDPGIGFGKTLEHNLELLRKLGRFGTLGCAVLVGTSRKGFLGAITGRPVDERTSASVVSSLAAAVLGANVLRVHDVAPMIDAIKVWGTVHGWSAGSPR